MLPKYAFEGVAVSALLEVFKVEHAAHDGEGGGRGGAQLYRALRHVIPDLVTSWGGKEKNYKHI